MKKRSLIGLCLLLMVMCFATACGTTSGNGTGNGTISSGDGGVTTTPAP